MLPHIRLRPLLTDEHKWGVLSEYLKESIDNLRTKLETCDPKELGNLQGQLTSLRTLLSQKAALNAEGNRG